MGFHTMGLKTEGLKRNCVNIKIGLHMWHLNPSISLTGLESFTQIP